MNEDFSDRRILVVDDVKANVDFLVEALRSEYKISVALGGEAALKVAEKARPDLLLLDILMPGIDGLEVCRRLRAAPATQEIPVIFLSSLEDVRDKARGFEAGGNDYLTKPFDIVEVKMRVRSLLKAKAYTDAVREKIAEELRIARDIQTGFLPADVASAARAVGMDVAAVLEPALEVGGDLYEVSAGADGTLTVVVGDVSGKGIPASLFMCVTMTLVRTIARSHPSPEVLLRHVNDALAAQNPQGLFTTLMCLRFDPKAGRVAFASAGHPPPVLLSPGRPPRFLEVEHGFPAGIFAGGEYALQTCDLGPGESLLLYTDGVTEAFDQSRREFGDEGLLTCLAGGTIDGAASTVKSVMAAVRRHAGDAPQSDDITVLTAGIPAA